jgi:hypothetical protein
MHVKSHYDHTYKKIPPIIKGGIFLYSCREINKC